MAHPHDDREQDPANAEGTPKGRRLGRILIPLVLLLIAAAVITYMLVIGSIGTDDSTTEDIEGAAAAVIGTSAPAQV
ncbi:hypothetical protein [Blastococcus sp. SYSU DS0619]